MQPVFDILLIGDTRVGKSAFVQRHKTGEFEKRHIPFEGCVTRSLDFYTNRGLVTLCVTECDIKTEIPNVDFHGVIMMFDVTNRQSYKNIVSLCEAQRVSLNVVLCGNKCDCKDREVKAKNMTFHRKHKIPYVEISARSNFRFERPFLEILKPLVGSDVVFTDAPALEPPTVEDYIDWQREMAEDAAMSPKTRR